MRHKQTQMYTNSPSAKHKFTQITGKVIGITGGFGTGKTTVAKMFSKYGAVILDADKIVHQLLKPGTKVFSKVIDAFGSDIIGAGRAIDRKKLAKKVFGDKANLKKLCDIVHPAAITELKKKIIKNRAKKLIIIDAPLLIEANLLYLVDKLIVVKADRKSQLARLKKLKGFTEKEINDRICAQLPLGEKLDLADFIVDNSGTVENTRRQVEKILERIKNGG